LKKLLIICILDRTQKQQIKMSDNKNSVAVGEEGVGGKPAADVKFLIICFLNTTGGAICVSLIFNPHCQYKRISSSTSLHPSMI
jgi:hypothetical protein